MVRLGYACPIGETPVRADSVNKSMLTKGVFDN